MTFVQKIRTYNVDEIDTCNTLIPFEVIHHQRIKGGVLSIGLPPGEIGPLIECKYLHFTFG